MDWQLHRDLLQVSGESNKADGNVLSLFFIIIIIILIIYYRYSQ